MIFNIVTLISALFISCIAAYYSIVGLTTLFNGAILAVTLMAISLEIGKIVSATWLHKNWSTAPILLKTYLSFAVIILMFITSMGIFGFLSKAHLQQSGSLSEVQLQIDKIDFDLRQEKEKINIENDKINSSQKVINQLNKSTDIYFDKLMIRRGLRERENQKEERNLMQKNIDQANVNIKNINQEISTLTAKKFNLESEIKNFEVEVGPVKYIADLIYGEEKSKNLLDQTIRYVIITFIFVFDPLAILLIIAANFSFKQEKLIKFSNKEDDVIEPEPINKIKHIKKKPILNKFIPKQKEISKKEKKLEEETILSIPSVEAAKKKDLEDNKQIEKIIYKPYKPSNIEIEQITNDIIKRLSESPQVPYNLDSGDVGNVVKNIISDSIEKEFKK